MAKHLIIIIYFGLCLFLGVSVKAQISHGGQPLPLTATKSLTEDMFITMPPFDLAEQLRLDSLEATGLRNGFRFAYKFVTDYTPENSGVHFTLSDGTKVWRLGIRSEGALSLNIMFSKYHLPEGARVFLYNSDQSEVLGSFNHLNNSERGILPVAPILGDELIIEYQEPAKTAFPGKLAVGEVNHGYRNLRPLGTAARLCGFQMYAGHRLLPGFDNPLRRYRTQRSPDDYQRDDRLHGNALSTTWLTTENLTSLQPRIA